MADRRTFAHALEIVLDTLAEDDQLYYAYQANIAMQFKDACARHKHKFSGLHEVANEAAKDFLDLWLGRTNGSRN